VSDAPDFTLPNVAAGPEQLSVSALAADHAGVLLLFQRDYHCGNCRKQVQAVADRYDEFVERDVAVVSVVPEPPERIREWQDSYDLPFPLVADPDATVAGDYGQPVRFGPLGRFSDLLGRMPKAVLLDTRGDTASLVYSHEGTSTWDRPSIDELLAAVDERLQ
jgi:peroxiredoxin Q/BCP